MTKIREVGRLIVTFVIVAAFVALVALLVHAYGGFDLLKAQWAARAAEAEAARLAAEAEALAARRALWAQLPLTVASLKDSVLVLFFAVCNWLLLAGVVIVLVWQRGQDREDMQQTEV